MTKAYFDIPSAMKLVRAAKRTLGTPTGGSSYSNEDSGIAGDWFFAKIMATGPSAEADYTDQRHWFQRVKITTTGGDDTNENVFEVIPDTDSAYLYATLENLSGIADSSHTIPEDTIVLVMTAYDSNDDAVPRFFTEWANASLPTGQYQYMVYQMTSNNQAGYDFVRLHPPI